MYRFVKVGSTFDFKSDNFWEINTQISLINPFRKLYLRDTSKDKRTSSNEMVSIWMYCDPSYENKVYRMPEKEKLEAVRFYYPEFDINEEIVKECIEQYDLYCLTPAARAFKEEEASLVKRAEFIKTSPYTFDDVERDSKGAVIFVAGKPMARKGTAKDLDSMRANTLKIYEQYARVRKIFEEEQGEVRIRGGRKESLRERGGLLEDTLDHINDIDDNG